MVNNLLIVFTKNSIPGTVKTRIGAKIGEKAALLIHHLLLDKTKNLISKINEEIKVKIYYSNHIDGDDIWPREPGKEIQVDADLGNRMQRAFLNELGSGAGKVCLIGTDILDFDKSTMERAFEILSKSDIAIGPATDGGYYLIGMKEYHPELFRDIRWGSDRVLKDTIARVNALNLSYELTVELIDVDEVEDIPDEFFDVLKAFKS